MAKPPVDTFEKMMSFISTKLRTQKLANYQPVMIKFLLVHGNKTKREIAEEIQRQNDPSKDISYYMTVPVYGVLIGSGIVTSQSIRNPIFSLNLKVFSKDEFDELMKQLDFWIARSNTFLKTGFLPMNEAREKARRLAKEHNLKNLSDWNGFARSGKKPDDLPSNPWEYYKKKNHSEK